MFTGDTGLRFALLGRLRAWRGDREWELGSPQQQAFRAVLLRQKQTAPQRRHDETRAHAPAVLGSALGGLGDHGGARAYRCTAHGICARPGVPEADDLLAPLGAEPGRRCGAEPAPFA